ncbi:MAG: hypothetical protein EHM23_06455 [Acidobacteria bacterium]|nr:MAG: hypothetical protein EHM23_06455 [Acidobacteriota bacterium]
MKYRRVLLIILLAFWTAPLSGMRVLVRWDLDTAPPSGLPGISGLAVPWGWGKAALVKSAADAGYRVYYLVAPTELEEMTPTLPGSPLSGVIILSGDLRTALKSRLQARPEIPASIEIAAAWETGHFPRILSNSVQNKDGVLQVAAASSQPWIESNHAAAAILRHVHPTQSYLHYSWPEGAGQPASVDDYLLAVSEAGASGVDLVLPLGPDFQRSLALDQPEARHRWRQIATCIDTYSNRSPGKLQPPGNLAVITEDFEIWYDLLKMLSRYNVPFRLIPRRELNNLAAPPLNLVLFLATPDPSETEKLESLLDDGVSAIVGLEAKEKLRWRGKRTAVFESDDAASYRIGKGQLVELYGSGTDPNALALDVRRILGKEHRPIQLWNALTVLTALYPQGQSEAVLYLTNYALSPQVVQVRVAGTFSKVQCVWPEKGESAALKFETDNGFTEVTVPDVKVGAIVTLSR